MKMPKKRPIYEYSLFDRAALRWAEVLISRNSVDAALAWLNEIERGLPDEGALLDACARLGSTFEEVWEVFRATVYRHGKRVIMPENHCPRTPFPDRPCTRMAGHDGDCELADVPLDIQLANDRRFAEELGAVAAAFALRGNL